MNAEELQRLIRDTLIRLDEQYGELPGIRCILAIYESDDGKFVLFQNLSEFEYYETNRRLFGQEIADYNDRFRKERSDE